MRRYLPIATVFLPVVLLYLTGVLEFAERSRMDAGFRLAGKPAPSDIVLVDIDTRTLRKLDSWPLAQHHHAAVLERLLDADARRIGVDLDLGSSSDPAEDAELERVLSGAGQRIVLPVYEEWQHASRAPRQSTLGPLATLRRHAALGTVDVRPETDGVVRRFINQGSGPQGPVPSMASVLAGSDRPGLREFYLDFGIDIRSIPTVSYVDVLTGRFDPRLIRDRAVIIGSSAAEPGNVYEVPVVGSLSGTMLQALAYECLTRGRTLTRAGPVFTLSIALLLTLLARHFFFMTSWRRGLLFVTVFSAGIVLAAGGVARFWPVIYDVVPWILVCFGVYFHALFSMIDEQSLGLIRQGTLIQRTESLMHHVVQSSFDAVVVVDDKGRVESFNRAAVRLFGYPEKRAVGRMLSDLIDRSDDVTSTHLRPTGRPLEVVGRSLDGRTFPVEMTVTALDAEGEPRFVAVLRDITERKGHQEQLQHQATHDPLTGLPNRALLLEQIQHAVEAARGEGVTVAVLLLDLDRFKEINDALGHRTGDILLKTVAKRLAGPLEPMDMLARLGGDEFGVLLPSAPLERVLHTGWKLVETLKTPFEIEGLSLQVDTSVGVTLFPDHGHDAETLLQRADVAMYVAKRKRCSLAVYQPEQDYNHMRHLKLRGDLRRAIEEDMLSVAYQPKVLAETGQVHAAEALVRWNHPEHGSIPPDEFISLAEHGGMIRPLTQWVLKTVIQQCARWRSRGLELNLSVNLSARNLLEEDLPLNVKCLLEAYKVPPSDLTLEITESVIMEDPERALRIVTRLHDLGTGISIDDFGTGYSSLAYLMRLPARELKIDRSFVMQMERDVGSATIVRSTIELAHNLGLKVVAEGVETRTVWDVLLELGCDVGQGYYFSRPVPPEELPETVRSFARAESPVSTPSAIDVEIEVETSDSMSNLAGTGSSFDSGEMPAVEVAPRSTLSS